MQKFKNFIFALVLSVMAASVFGHTPVLAYDGLGDDLFDDLEEVLYYLDEDDYNFDYDDYSDYFGEDNSGSENKDTVNKDSANKSEQVDASDLTKKNSETGYVARVDDMAGILSKAECNSILGKAYDITKFCDMYVITTNVNTFGNSENATFKFCDDYYLKNSKTKNVVIFIIDMATRYIYIYRNGTAKENLSQGKCDSITDNVYSDASKKDYLNCSLNAIDQIGKVLDGQRIAQPMKVVSNLFIAFVCGFVVMYLIALGKSKASKPSDSELLKYVAKNFQFANQSDIITGTTKTYCPRSSGSGGRGGGGGHSSGGGGGGHRF